MSVILNSIEDAGPDRRARRLIFSDTTERQTAAVVMRASGIEVGDEVQRSELEAELAQLERDHARERALRLVGYRERSAHQLLRRLVDDGYPPEVADLIVGRFIELGLVDDERFARMYVRSRRRSGFGPRRVARELRERGISDEVALVAMSESDAIDPVESAKRVIGVRPPGDQRERERFIRRLITKGFDMRTALEAVGSPDSDPRD